MKQCVSTFSVNTEGEGLYEITREVSVWLHNADISTGLLTLFCRHTSAGLLITENASPAVWRDMQRWFAAIAPESGRYEHDDEGPDDMPAHLRTVLTGNSVSVPVSGGRMMLGTWQGIFLAEHRRRPHRREIVLHVSGE